MKILLSFFAASVAALGAVHAQSNFLQSVSPTDIIPNFNVENLEPAVTASGASATMLINQDGGYAVGVEMASGVRFIMIPTVCSDEARGCRGVSLQTFFGEMQVPLELLNAFNSAGTIPKAIGHGDRVTILHYLVADYGIIRGNFESHLQIMDISVQMFVQGQRRASSGQAVSVSMRETVAKAAAMDDGALLIDPIHETPALSPAMKAFLKRK